MRPVHYGRSLLLQAREREAQPSTEQGQARLIHSQLVRLGNNLNQLVRQLHRLGQAPLPGDLLPLLEEIRRLIARVPR